VLVALSSLLAGGWGPQQLATELVDDLRQVFLAALAPELCAMSGTSRERFTGLAETMGLAKVVRGMEILGRALIDMRDAPDAQVVLEIAMVRATRPDLDSGMEALTERVGTLERSMSPVGLASRPILRAEPVAPAPASVPPSTPAEVGRRPSVGAVRRGKEIPPDPSPAEPAPESAMASSDLVSAPAPAATPVGPVDRDSLTEAWGDGILRSLPARAKALYSAGRFVAVDDQGAQFALPNVAHRDRCSELTAQVEMALTDHFGTTVKLILVVDDAKPGGPARSDAPVRAPSSPSGQSNNDEMEEMDPDDLLPDGQVTTDQASSAEARLLEAFPGASEVVG
jgi:DNA polymerase-3 subunit gamma/tau